MIGLHVFLGIAAFASASPAPLPQFPVPKGDGTNGSGPHPAKYTTDPGLKGYTIFAPIKAPEEKVPVILWANGMCMDQGLGFRNLLNDIASYGYVVVANGAPEGTGQASDQKLLTSLEYVAKNAGSANGPLSFADGTRIAAAGQSCGGWQAYKASTDRRIKATGIFDSGGKSGNILGKLHAPIAYFLGGSSDMAFKPVRRWILDR
jgi:predicted dienelactone hydrolase